MWNLYRAAEGATKALELANDMLDIVPLDVKRKWWKDHW